MSAGNQILQPVPGYSWTWGWTATNVLTLASSTSTPPISGLGDSQRLVSIPTGITDSGDRLHVRATVNMPSSGNSFYAGNQTYQEVPVRIFICNVPWPPVTTSNVDNWQPFKDSTACNPNTGECDTFNYEFYYCRDTADPNVLLPALTTGGVNNGRSARKVCSDNRLQECSADSYCGANNFCIWEILKESYFFRDNTVPTSNNGNQIPNPNTSETSTNENISTE
jgi:hypothetical protein